ncbi:MAG: hypothetical protein QOF58_6656 [Pseudonocardiales bacterium]|jgi:hypothetical protein|nr:hypothetical protein [Actinomycetota bacterium]MDT7788237.1 hypothetical protein [Pseudonocardiales bacterium]
MTAKRYTVRMYWRSSMQVQEDTNLDPRDDAILRQTLERMVQARQGTLRLDLSEYSIVVHSAGGGRVHARCGVASNGATQVRR